MAENPLYDHYQGDGEDYDYYQGGDDFNDYQDGDDYDDCQGSSDDYDDYQGDDYDYQESDDNDYQESDDNVCQGETFKDCENGDDNNADVRGSCDDLDYHQGNYDSDDHQGRYGDLDEDDDDQYHGDCNREEYQGDDGSECDNFCDWNNDGQSKGNPDHGGIERHYSWCPGADRTPNPSHDRFFGSHGHGRSEPHQRRLVGGCGRSRGRGRGGLEPRDRPVGGRNSAALDFNIQLDQLSTAMQRNQLQGGEPCK